jgi:RNA polymerase sigma factor (sigma-70 family)
LSAWRVSLADKPNSRELEATGNKTSPETQEYDSTDAESSVPCPDRIPLNEDQRGLAVRYMPMPHHLAQRLCAILPAESEELESTAYLALGEAAQSFDSSRKVGFGTFARHRIRAALRDLQRVLSFDCRPGRGEEGQVRAKLGRFHDRIGGRLGIEPDQPLGAGTDEAEAVDEWLRRLPKAHSAVCHFIYKGCKSEVEVATELGCSQSMLSRLQREAVTGLIRAYHRARSAHPQE